MQSLDRTGAPKAACAEMAPQHGDAVPQTNSSPFRVTAVPGVGGSMTTVTISSPSADKFKGFLISARSPADVGVNGGTNLGQFFPGVDASSQTLTCNSTAVSFHFRSPFSRLSHPVVYVDVYVCHDGVITIIPNLFTQTGCHHSQEQRREDDRLFRLVSR